MFHTPISSPIRPVLRAPKPERGFTLVEAIVVVLVVAAILAMLVPILRERERQRLQAVADAYSREVFEFRAEPAKESFAEGEEIIVHCEILNPTGYPLTLRTVLDKFHLIFGDTRYFVGFARMMDSMSQTAIDPGESVSFDVTLRPIGAGTAEVRIVYGDDIACWRADEGSLSTRVEHIGIDLQGRIEVRGVQQTVPVNGRSLGIITSYFLHEQKGDTEFRNFRGILPNNEKRFQSQAFQLVVKKSDSSQLPTFDEIIAGMEQREASR